MTNMFVEWKKYKKYKIKEMSLSDGMTLTKPVEYYEKKWFIFKEKKTRDPNIGEVKDRVRDYILKNSKPRLDIDNIKIEYLQRILDITGINISIEKDTKKKKKKGRL